MNKELKKDKKHLVFVDLDNNTIENELFNRFEYLYGFRGINTNNPFQQWYPKMKIFESPNMNKNIADVLLIYNASSIINSFCNIYGKNEIYVIIVSKDSLLWNLQSIISGEGIETCCVNEIGQFFK